MRRPIFALVALQCITAIAIAFGWVEREAAFFVTAALLMFMALRPLEEGMMLFILSIPFFFALPFSGSFDSMASWRILLSILFIRYLVEIVGDTRAALQNGAERIPFTPSLRHSVTKILGTCWHSRLFWITCAFLGWAAISSLVAPYPAVGIKKVLFFANIFLLYPVIRYVTRREGFKNILSIVYSQLFIVLVIGFLQLASIFFLSIEKFWRFWAGHVIPVFYGYELGELLQTSNTWFSFGGDGPPLLRMFSVFPDSHSFALFVIIGLIIPVSMAVVRSKSVYRLQVPTLNAGRELGSGNDEVGEKQSYSSFLIPNSLFLIPVGFLALIFSGSRGVWLSALATVVLLSTVYATLRFWPQIQRIKSILRHLMLGFVLFGVLFLPASLISSLSQRAQGAKADSLASLKRAKSIADLDEVSNRSRLQIWKAALDTVKVYPVFGVGTGNFSVALGEDITAARRGASAHNLYLDIASEMGIPGLLLFVCLIGYVLRIVFLRVFFPPIPDTKYQMPITTLVVFLVYFLWILGYSLFDVVLFNDKVFILAMIIVALALTDNENISTA